MVQTQQTVALVHDSVSKTGRQVNSELKGRWPVFALRLRKTAEQLRILRRLRELQSWNLASKNEKC
jgi:hypothetical protein